MNIKINGSSRSYVCLYVYPFMYQFSIGPRVTGFSRHNSIKYTVELGCNAIKGSDYFVLLYRIV
jgi:hypothetical protein